MKTNKFLRIASVLLIAVLLSTCVISGTFAKYVSTASGSDTARVAKWSIKVEDTEIAISPNATVKFNLFDTVTFKDSNGTAAEADVKAVATNEELIIAPGTSGSFELNVANLSEVNATFDIDFTATTNNIPLKFKIGEGEWTTTIGTLNVNDAPIAMETGTAAYTVYWMWDYTGEDPIDANDTALGIDAQDGPVKATVTATITATQVD